MVYACCFWPVEYRDRLVKLKFKGINIPHIFFPSNFILDSKVLNEIERNDLFGQIQEIDGKELGYKTDIIEAEVISNKMLQKFPCSLNKMSHESCIKLIEHVLDLKIKLTHVK
jgi:hypothetical protein